MLGVSSAESLLNTVWLNNIFWNACLSRAWRFVLWDVKQRNISTPKVTNITMIDRQKEGLE